MKKFNCLLLCSLITFIVVASTNISYSYASDSLKIHYIDVGSADSIYIECGGQSMLIDGGYLTQYDRSGETDDAIKSPLDRYMHDGDDTVLDSSAGQYMDQYKKLLRENDNSDVTKYLDSLGVKEIDYVVSTHPHYDHIGGLIQVLNKYNYKHLLYNGREYNAYLPTFKKMAEYNKSKNGVELTVANQGQVIELGAGSMKARITVLTNQATDYSTISGRNELNTISNNGSLVLKLEYGKRSFLFTGDAQVAAQRELIKNKITDITNIDVLKVPHHGYNNNDFNSPDKSGNYEFFQNVNPVVSVVSCDIGNNNSPLPANRVIKDLAMSDIYTTKDLGNIVLTCNGKSVIVKTNSKTIYALNPGDLNKDGKITASDLLKMEKYVVNPNDNQLRNTELRIGDTNDDGKVNSRDMLAVEKNIVFNTPID
ncbi:MAG: MBL fold metallo-hydrolase [Coprobacillus sp.]